MVEGVNKCFSILRIMVKTSIVPSIAIVIQVMGKYVHSNLTDTDLQGAGTSLNQAAFFKIKCLELGVVIGVAMACCSVFLFTDISHLRAPSGPKVPRYHIP